MRTLAPLPPISSRRMRREQMQHALDLERLVDALQDLGERVRAGESLRDTRRHGFAEEDERAAVGDRKESAVVDVERAAPASVSLSDSTCSTPRSSTSESARANVRGRVALRGAGDGEDVASDERIGADAEQRGGDAVDVRDDAARVDRDRAFGEVSRRWRRWAPAGYLAGPPLRWWFSSARLDLGVSRHDLSTSATFGHVT